MAEPKRFDINKIENFLKNSADKAQILSYWNAAVEHGKTVKEIDENLASNVDDKQIADLLLRRTDAINRRDRLIKAVENAMKVKYQPQIRYPKCSQQRTKQCRADWLSCSINALALEG